MTTGADAYHLGRLDGSKPKQIYDPPSYMSSADKKQYYQGFHDARKERGTV